MVKKKSKKTSQKKENKIIKKTNEKPIIELNKSTAITAVIFLLIGLIVGAMGVWAINQINEQDLLVENTWQSPVGSDLKQKVTDYLNENFLDPQMAIQGMKFTLEETDNLSNDVFGYEVYADIDGLLQPTGSIIYVIGDNFTIGSSIFNINKSMEENLGIDDEVVERPEGDFSSSDLTDEQKEEILAFSTCLAESGVKIYGADWCGPTNQLVNNLGGFDLISPIYVECTKQEELCAQEQISGYPTIKINGERINPQRNFEGFEKVTGCKAPKITFSASTSTTTNTC